MGDVSDTRKHILENTLTDELKKYFRIVPQEKYEQVLEQVFEELEYEECSEDTCIMRVQEMLQVENVFNLQIIGEGDDTQLNLKWVTLDEKKNETELCSGCGTVELNGIVKGLVGRLVGGKTVEPVDVVEKENEFGTKQLGTSSYDGGNGVTTDSSGNIYVTGITFGRLDGNTNSGYSDIFLIKFNSSGIRQ